MKKQANDIAPLHVQDIEKARARRAKALVKNPPTKPAFVKGAQVVTPATFYIGGIYGNGLGPLSLFDMINGQPKFRHIPDMVTFNNLFENSIGYVSQPAFAWMVNEYGGSDIPSGSVLARGSGEAAVYFCDGADARRLTSSDAFVQWHFNAATILSIAPAIVSALNDADDIFTSDFYVEWDGQ
jgi:hypothetical protein